MPRIRADPWFRCTSANRALADFPSAVLEMGSGAEAAPPYLLSPLASAPGSESSTALAISTIGLERSWLDRCRMR